MMKYCLLYIVILNIISFFLMGIDKRKAKKQRWRISEKTLLLCAAFGGSIGILFGMTCFHHKTKKKKFSFGVPFLLLFQCILLFYFL